MFGFFIPSPLMELVDDFDELQIGLGDSDWSLGPGATEGAFAASDSILTITGTPEAGNQSLTTSASYISQYGYYEIRMLADTPAGWSFDWRLVSEDGSAAIIIVRQSGPGAGMVRGGVEHPVGTPVGLVETDPGGSASFRTYGVEWLPDRCIWYLDRVPYGQVSLAPQGTLLESNAYLSLDLNIEPGATTTSVVKIDYIMTWDQRPY